MRTKGTIVFGRSDREDEPRISERVNLIMMIARGGGTLAIRELAEALETRPHPSTVREHLLTLEAVGVVHVEKVGAHSKPRLLRRALQPIDTRDARPGKRYSMLTAAKLYDRIWVEWKSAGMTRGVDAAKLVDERVEGLETTRQVKELVRELEEMRWLEVLTRGSSKMRVVPSVFAIVNHALDEGEHVQVTHEA